jgi:uncharacterized protein (DUF1684 family)
MNTMLREAEARAGVAHVPMNAMHRFRRGAAGNVNAATNDPLAAMHWIGDTDLKYAMTYLKRRDRKMQEVADSISATQTAPEYATEPQPDDSTPTGEDR